MPFYQIEKDELPRYRLATDDDSIRAHGRNDRQEFTGERSTGSRLRFLSYSTPFAGHGLLPEFVSLFFQSDEYWEVVKAGMIGSAQGGFNASKLAALTIPIPPSSEQRRIVSVLDEAFERIATAKANAARNVARNVANARALFESRLSAEFTKSEDVAERVTLESLMERG